jgi:putative membrane protein
MNWWRLEVMMESDSAAPTPPVPPPIPPTIPPLIAPDPPRLEGRLHPLTLVFAFWNAVRNILLPLIVIYIFGRRRGSDAYIWIAAIFLGLPVAWAVIRYFTFTYRIENGELITRHGLLGRTERNIPLGRVQDIRIEQGVLHRLLGMADVFVETAGGRGPEASLSVLAKSEAERLRAAVFAAPVDRTAGTTAPQPEREVIRILTIRDLILAGLTSNRAASALALVVVLWQFVDDIVPQDTYQRWGEWFAQRAVEWQSNGAGVHWLLIVLAAVAMLGIGMLFSVIGSVVVFYGFTLARSGEDIYRSHGLFTRRSSSLPRRRIQLLKVEEPWLRRLFKLATLRADTAGAALPGQNKEEQSGRDVLLPVLPRRDLESLLPVFFPDLDEADATWKQVSRRAIVRGTKKGAAICLLLAALSCSIQRSWYGLWPLLFVPAVYALNVMSYRHLGYWLGDRFFRMRSGWLSRATHIVPIRNVQSIVVRQTPFDRRHKVSTLVVDSAGQTNTGGGPRIRNVPTADVLNVARTLAHRAASTRYRV